MTLTSRCHACIVTHRFSLLKVLLANHCRSLRGVASSWSNVSGCVLSSLFGLLSLLSCCWWLSLLLSLALAVRSCLVSLVAFMVPVFVSGCVRCVGACGCVS